MPYLITFLVWALVLSLSRVPHPVLGALFAALCAGLVVQARQFQYPKRSA